MARLIFIVAILVFALCGFVPHASAQVNVTQKNNNPSRDGLYIDPLFTPGNAANLVRDLNFDGTSWATFTRSHCTSKVVQTDR